MLERIGSIFLAAVILLQYSTLPSFALENVRVAYPTMGTGVFYQVVAQKEGYYKEEGLNVELLNVRGEIAIKTALAGEVDLFTNAGSALAGAVRGVPLKVLTVIQDKPSWELIVQPQIKSIAQLKGTTIGIMSPEGSLAVVTREILRKNGIDPAKDVNLIVMGGEDVRFMAMKGKAISGTLLAPTSNVRAQKEGFLSLAKASDYTVFLQGGLATTDDRIKRSPEKIGKFLRASHKGHHYFLTKREQSITYMMEILRLKDRELASLIYDIESKSMLREGVTSEKVLQGFIDDMKKTTGVKREIAVTDIFDFRLIRKVNEDLKASGWKP
ncbi:MAG: ABC transporter substrate-binding protein [Candidatus Binatia bacterium]